VGPGAARAAGDAGCVLDAPYAAAQRDVRVEGAAHAAPRAARLLLGARVVVGWALVGDAVGAGVAPRARVAGGAKGVKARIADEPGVIATHPPVGRDGQSLALAGAVVLRIGHGGGLVDAGVRVAKVLAAGEGDGVGCAGALGLKEVPWHPHVALGPYAHALGHPEAVRRKRLGAVGALARAISLATFKAGPVPTLA